MNLVTGAFGFSGSHVITKLLEAGEHVVGTDLQQRIDDPKVRDDMRIAAIPIDHPNLKLVGASLLDPKGLTALFKHRPDRVFHTASLYDYSASLDTLRAINVTGTQHLLDAALASGKTLERFVHWSTCGVFGKPYTTRDGAKVNVPFSEDSPSPKNTPDHATAPPSTHLVNAYSVSKWEQEKRVWQAHREHGLPLTVVRPAPIYGPGSSYGHGGIILAIAHGLLPAIPRDARNYITTSVHVEDVAGFAVHVADQPESLGEDYNIVDDSIISYWEFLQYIALLCGRPLAGIPLVKQEHLRPFMVGAAKAWTWAQRRLNVPRVRVLEIQSATYVSSSYWLSNRKSQAAGYSYRYPDVREGLKDTVAWFRRQGWLTDTSRLLA